MTDKKPRIADRSTIDESHQEPSSRDQGAPPTARRNFIAVVGAGAAGALASGLVNTSSAQADNGQPLFLGRRNFATTTTALFFDGSDAGLTVEAIGAGSTAAIEAVNLTSGPLDAGPVSAVDATVDTPHGAAVVAHNESGVGLYSEGDTGLIAQATQANQPAVQANAADVGGLALRVLGKTALATVGEFFFSPGVRTVFVPYAGVTPRSHISVTLTSDAAAGLTLRRVIRHPGEGFTGVLDNKPKVRIPATFSVFEPTGK